ncbi:MAG TPA: carboxyltransferase domain-containing protein [Thermoanaerobaculia bacterium]
MDIARAGDRAVLVQLDPAISAAELHAAGGRVRALPDVLASIVGHSSLYVICSRVPDVQRVRDAVSERVDRLTVSGYRLSVEVSFRDEYAPNLREFLRHARITRDEFLTRLRDLRLVVRYVGFRGGFAYLDGWPAEWAMPRRPTSRAVARGSFAIAGSVAGFYPLDSPGGWNILGRTAEPLENRVSPGDEIAIVPVETALPPVEKLPRNAEPPPGISAPFITRVRAADWSNIDRGVSPGGPFDAEAAEVANVAVGNGAGAELFEFAQIAPRISLDGVVAWSDARDLRVYHLNTARPLEIGRIRNGYRGYLAVGSATNLPAPIRGARPQELRVIRAMHGPHALGIDELECEVTPALDRVGIRMRPLRPIRFTPPADMPSCGMQFGTLQLHIDGSIVAMGPDHPVTGGYLQPMTVLWSERWKLAHLAPGERVRFVAQSP